MGMEYNINEHEELQQMREQIATLRSKLESQTIVSEKMILAAISQGVKKINRRGLIFLIFGFLAIPYCNWVFSWMNFSDNFVIGTTIMMVFCVAATAYFHFGLKGVDVVKENMLDVSKRVLRLRKQYVYWNFVSVPMIVVWVYFLYSEICVIFPEPEVRLYFGIGALMGIVIGAAIGLWQHFKVIRTVDEVLAHIRDLQE
jgi:hypothetical protein